MSLTVSARSDAAPDRVWALYAQPERWREWAPHIRSPRGLGTPEVEAGARGSVRLAGIAPIPATITDVDPGESWAWRVGPLSLRHTVSREAEGGTAIGLEIDAPGPLEPALRFTYVPLTRALLANLGRVAETRTGSDLG